MPLLRSAALAALAGALLTTGASAKEVPAAAGGASDPPAVVGEPYAVGGVTHTPADAPFDEVGSARLDPDAGANVAVTHRTLPLPSYVEVTALDSGRTILARVERRGPADASALAGLSPAAVAQLGLDPAVPAAVRVRRVNPQEYERSLLRTGQRAPERLPTPKALLEVLRKLHASKAQGAAATPVAVEPATVPPAEMAVAATPVAATSPAVKNTGDKPVSARKTAPLPKVPAGAAASGGQVVVQVAVFASRANADATATKLGGKVSAAGKLWRVRLGPFASRDAASAALDRARKADFADARIAIAGQ